MQRLFSVIKIQSCTWDFAKDGGAVGLIPTPIIIPVGAIIIFASIKIIENVTSIAGQFNLQDSATTGLISVPTLPAALITPADNIAGFVTNATGNGLPLNIEIFTNSLLSGKVAFSVGYIDVST